MTPPPLPLPSSFSNFSSPPDSGRIRCVCEYDEDDGFTIQCEQCLVWQHAKCVGISKNSVPEQYFCEECKPGWHEDLHNLALRAINLDVISHSHSNNLHLNLLGNVNIIEDSGTNNNSNNNNNNNNSSSRTFKRRILMPLGVPALNEISENIISNDAHPLIESFIKGLNVPRLKRQQNSQDPNLINFEFQSTVVMDSSEHLALLQKNLEVREIRNRGYQKKGSSTKFGLFAMESCDPGHFVCEFIGHVQLKNLLTVKGSKELPVSVTQSFVLYPLASIDLAVDARKFGTGIRYARRSCRPNVQIKPIIVEGRSGELNLSWGLFARNVIKANSEIFLPLDYQCGNGLFRYECACNALEFCLGPLDNFNPTTPILKESALQKPASPKPVSVAVESAELEALGIRRSSSTVLQDLQSVPSSTTRPILDTRKLTREERKLQKYIEYFERMDNADAAKKVTTSSSNSSIGSRKGSSSGTSPQASSSRISSPELNKNANAYGNAGGLKKAWKKLFSSGSGETEMGSTLLETVEAEEVPSTSVTGKKRGRKPSIKTKSHDTLITDSTISTSNSDSAFKTDYPVMTETSPNPSSPLKPKPKSPPKRKKTPSSSSEIDIAIVDEEFVTPAASMEEIDVGSETAVVNKTAAELDSKVMPVTKKKESNKRTKTKGLRDDKEMDGSKRDGSDHFKRDSLESATESQYVHVQMLTTTLSPLIDIERSSSVVNSEPPIGAASSTTAPDTPSKKKLSLSDYLKKKKASPVGIVSLNFDENDPSEGANNDISINATATENEEGEITEHKPSNEIFSFLGNVAVSERDLLRQSVGSISSVEDHNSQQHGSQQWDHRIQQYDHKSQHSNHHSSQHINQQYSNQYNNQNSSQFRSKPRDDREKEFDRLQREREFERREAERERDRRERERDRERPDRDYLERDRIRDQQHTTNYSGHSGYNTPAAYNILPNSAQAYPYNRPSPSTTPHYRPSYRPHHHSHRPPSNPYPSNQQHPNYRPAPQYHNPNDPNNNSSNGSRPPSSSNYHRKSNKY